MIRYEVQKGRFIKHCPCTPDVISCGYYNINLHTGCPFGCSYCILQAYLETKEPVFFTNLDDLEKELEEISGTVPYLRLGTGELSDSLAWDPQTKYSVKLLSIIEKFPQVIFEFKTKSTHIREIMNWRTSLKNVVIAWSLNPKEIIEREEPLTPDLYERLEAISIAAEKGYKVGIHFDPIVYSQNWKSQYSTLVKEISRKIKSSQVAWWSMGALRFPYSLREHIFKHHDSGLFDGELIQGHDGKYRYFKPLRMELFKFTRDCIYSELSSSIPLYLCMEDREVWEEILPGLSPNEADVNRYLYESVLPGKVF